MHMFVMILKRKIKNETYKKRKIYVEPSKGPVMNEWSGGAAGIDDKIIQRMRKVLQEDIDYAYLSSECRVALKEARRLASKYDLRKPYITISNKQILIHPWIGSRKMDTLYFCIVNKFREELKLQSAYRIAKSLGITIKTELTAETFWRKLLILIQHVIPDDIIPIAPPIPLDRYDDMISEYLLRKAFVFNNLDIDGLKDLLTEK